MIYLAFCILALLALTLAYAYMIRPAMRQLMAPRRVAEPFEEPQQAAAGKRRIVYVYMDGCGWCERFTPVWASFVDENGKRLQAAGVEALRVVSSDPRASRYDVRAFPAVLFDAGGGAPPVPFEGERTVAGLVKFLGDNGVSLREGFYEPRRIGMPNPTPAGSGNVVAQQKKLTNDKGQDAAQSAGGVAGADSVSGGSGKKDE